MINFAGKANEFHIMPLSELTAVSPVDGRYRSKVEPLADYFSEFALIRYRVFVEVEYFIALCQLPLPPLAEVSPSVFPKLRSLYKNFDLNDAQEVKDLERKINHDVKAVEYFVKEGLSSYGLDSWKEFVHFGLTSQDINNTAVPVSLLHFTQRELIPGLERLIDDIATLSQPWKEIPMLARTHGQPASPTTMGKEMQVFIDRLQTQVRQLEAQPISGKFGGATGNFNAHMVAFPDIDWVNFANHFLTEKLGIQRQQVTTQIEHYDQLAALLDNVKRINTILIDLCRDVWQYISMEYFKQKVNAGEVGSSAMPHKVNPIDFENAEGNLGMANTVLSHLSGKLPISRLQRDLTDSTVLRNLGVPFAHMQIALQSLHKGLHKLTLNAPALKADLDKNFMVIAEAIQTILRAKGVENPYEQLKQLTRTGQRVDQAAIHAFIDGLAVDEATKARLKSLTPQTYTGNAAHG